MSDADKICYYRLSEMCDLTTLDCFYNDDDWDECEEYISKEFMLTPANERTEALDADES